MGWKRKVAELSGSLDTMFDTNTMVFPLMKLSSTTPAAVTPIYFMLNPDTTQYTEITKVSVLGNVQTSGTFLLRSGGTTTVSAFTTGSILVGTEYAGGLSGTVQFAGGTVFNVLYSGDTTGSYNVFVFYKNLK